MRIHVLVEGPSEAALLRGWFRRFLPHHALQVIQHRGKGKLSGNPERNPEPRREGLLDQLPATLRAYGRALNPAAERVMVLVDLDDDHCTDLKGRMTALLDLCDPKPTVLFRIAIEETEAFYLGDPAAIRRAFPQARLNKINNYVQDSVCGTWELFRDVIGAQSDNKVEWAARMGEQLGTDWRGTQANRSPSFRQFCIALRKLAGEPVD